MAHYVDSFPGRKILLDDKEYHYFGGTAYLGLQTDPDFQDLLIKNIRQYGTNYGSSRHSNIRISVYTQAEAFLASLSGAEACITLSSGYLAGQFISNFFYNKQYAPFYAPNTHSALYRSKEKSYTTYTALNIALRQHLSKKKRQAPVLFLDSIDFSGCNYPDFEGLRSLPLEDVILVVDDSHGIGVVGPNGGGVFRLLSPLPAKELIVCCSLGKGFGIQAGAVLGTKQRTTELTNTPFFGGASPASPAPLAALLQGKGICSQKRKLLQAHTQLFLGTLKSPEAFRYMDNHPTYSHPNFGLTDYLTKNGVITTNFNYPGEDASLVHRIVLSAAHTTDDIERLVYLINSYGTS